MWTGRWNFHLGINKRLVNSSLPSVSHLFVKQADLQSKLEFDTVLRARPWIISSCQIKLQSISSEHVPVTKSVWKKFKYGWLLSAQTCCFNYYIAYMFWRVILSETVWLRSFAAQVKIFEMWSIMQKFILMIVSRVLNLRGSNSVYHVWK